MIRIVSIVHSAPWGFCVFRAGTARNGQRYDSSISTQMVESIAALLTGRCGR